MSNVKAHACMGWRTLAFASARISDFELGLVLLSYEKVSAAEVKTQLKVMHPSLFNTVSHHIEKCACSGSFHRSQQGPECPTAHTSIDNGCVVVVHTMPSRPCRQTKPLLPNLISPTNPTNTLPTPASTLTNMTSTTITATTHMRGNGTGMATMGMAHTEVEVTTTTTMIIVRGGILLRNWDMKLNLIRGMCGI